MQHTTERQIFRHRSEVLWTVLIKNRAQLSMFVTAASFLLTYLWLTRPAEAGFNGVYPAVLMSLLSYQSEVSLKGSVTCWYSLTLGQLSFKLMRESSFLNEQPRERKGYGEPYWKI